MTFSADPNYPVRDRMLVDVNKFVREERAVWYATFSRHILSLAGQQRWRWVKLFTNILSLTGHFWNEIFKKQTSDFLHPTLRDFHFVRNDFFFSRIGRGDGEVTQ